MKTSSRWVAVVIGVLAFSGCAMTSVPTVPIVPSLTVDFPVDCGPIQDVALCQKAVEVAATAKLNPPPIANASIRRPRLDDDCAERLFNPCGSTDVVVVIQSGDTLQDIALVRSGNGWVLHDHTR